MMICSYGSNALFIEHPTDKTNRVKAGQLGKSELPQGDPDKLPYTICGPYLKKLFDRAFIDGLHNPSARPTAQEWEVALVKTCDLVQPCQNPKCEALGMCLTTPQNLNALSADRSIKDNYLSSTFIMHPPMESICLKTIA